MAISTAAAVIGGATLISGYLGYKGSKEQAGAMEAASATQTQIAAEQLNFAREQWSTYQTKVLPIELEAQRLGISAQRLALTRGQDEQEMYQDYYRPMQIKMSELAMEGVEDQTGRVTREAAETVSQQFERQRDITKRNQERAGIRPDSGRYKATERAADLSEAATRSTEVNQAREREVDRQEGLNFNRLASATGRAPAPYAPTQQTNVPGLNPSGISGIYGSAGRMAGAAGASAANAAGLRYQGIASMIGGGIDAYSAYKSLNSMQPSGFGFDTGGASNFAYGGGYGTVPGSEQSSMLASQNAGFKDGGLVKKDKNGEEPGRNIAERELIESKGAAGSVARSIYERNKRQEAMMKELGFKDGGVVGLCRGGRVKGYADGGMVKAYADGGKVKDDYSADNAATQTVKESSGMMGFAARWLDEYKGKQKDRMREAGIPGYADGGPVGGPGGVDNVPATIDGTTPAALSSGEYVIPTDVVNAKGTEFFDKLLNNFHEGPTPETTGAGLRPAAMGAQ